jgi:small membrane protein
MTIQIILIALILFGAIYFLSHANTYRVRAWKKILLVIFTLFMIVSIIWPDVTTKLAHHVGIGRGADLILYFVAIGFIFESINVHLKFQKQRSQMHKLARKIAILEAKHDAQK